MTESLGRSVLDLDVDATRFDSGLTGAKARTEEFQASSMGAMNRTSSHMQGKFSAMGASAHRFGKAFSLSVGIALGLAAEKSAEEMGVMSHAQADAQATVEKLGKHTRVTAAGIEEMSTKIQHATGANEALVTAGADTILSLGKINTNTKAGHALFERSSALMVDVAARMGTDIPSAGKMMQRVLADPGNIQAKFAKNLGISKDQLKAFKDRLEKIHDPTKRQAAAMDLLGSSVKGYAAMKMQHDPVAKFQESMLEMKQVGGRLLLSLMPLIQQVTGVIGGLMDRFDKLSPAWKKVAVGALLFGVVLEPLITIGEAVAAVIEAISLPMLAVAAAIAIVVVGFVELYRHSAQFRQQVARAVQGAKAAIMPFAADVKKTLAALGNAWKAHGDAIMRVVARAFGPLASLVGGMLKAVLLVMRAVMAAIRGDWSGAWSDLVGAFKAELSGVAGYLKGVGKLWYSALKTALSAIGKLASWVGAEALSIGTAIVDGIVHGIEAGAGRVADAAKSLAGKAASTIKKALSIHSPSRLFRDEVGLPIAQGMALGISDGADAVAAQAQNLADRLQAIADKAHATATQKTRAANAQRRATHLAAAASSLQAGHDNIMTNFQLGENWQSLQTAMNNGVENVAAKLKLLETTYTKLQTYLKKHKNLSRQLRSDIFSEMADIMGQINTLQAPADTTSIAATDGGVGATTSDYSTSSGVQLGVLPFTGATQTPSVSVVVNAQGATNPRAVGAEVGKAVARELERTRAGRNVRGLRMRTT